VLGPFSAVRNATSSIISTSSSLLLNFYFCFNVYKQEQRGRGDLHNRRHTNRQQTFQPIVCILQVTGKHSLRMVQTDALVTSLTLSKFFRRQWEKKKVFRAVKPLACFPENILVAPWQMSLLLAGYLVCHWSIRHHVYRGFWGLVELSGWHRGPGSTFSG